MCPFRAASKTVRLVENLHAVLHMQSCGVTALFEYFAYFPARCARAHILLVSKSHAEHSCQFVKFVVSFPVCSVSFVVKIPREIEKG